MSNRYVDVTITSQTKAVSQQGFGTPLILDTGADFAYKEYSDLTAVAEDFVSGTEVHNIASVMFSQNPKPSKVAVHGSAYTSGTDAPTDLSAALDSLVLDHGDFYFLVSVEQGDGEIQELASWADANEKVYAASTTNQALSVNAQRAFVQVHPNAETEYPAEAWVGRCAPLAPGSITWQFKTLTGVTNAAYSPSEVDAIHANNLNTYVKEGGVLITSAGVTTDGSYIDIIRGQDYLKSTMTTNVFTLLANAGKVPFTVGGIAQVVAEVEASLKDGANQGIIAEDVDGRPLYEVTTPDLAEISASDKANRMLPGVDWTATVAGAIHDVEITGTTKL